MKKTILIEIDGEFGSKFQKATALASLAMILKSWTVFYENSHKKNKVKYKLTEDGKTNKKVVISSSNHDEIIVPRGGFEDGGWYGGRQYFQGRLGPVGVIIAK